MKKYYAKAIPYASEDHKRHLVDSIDATQRGNESQIKGDVSRYVVPLQKVNKLAQQIWGKA